MARVVFTVHKAASMFLHELCSDIGELYQLTHFSPNHPQDDERSLFLAERDLGGHPAWQDVRALLSPIRYPRSVPAEAPIDHAVIHLRDPRDALTSRFFSFAYSHPRGAEYGDLTDDSARMMEEQGIDAYVRERCPMIFLRFYAFYRDLLRSRPDIPLLRYEEMVSDFPGWLRNLLTGLGLPLDARAHVLAKRHERAFTVDAEDLQQHRRQVASGDAWRKLAPDTLDAIWAEYAHLLLEFGYGENGWLGTEAPLREGMRALGCAGGRV